MNDDYFTWLNDESLPRIDVTQADLSYAGDIAEVELYGRDFPLQKEEVQEVIKDVDIYSTMLRVNGRVHAWVAFHAEANDIYIDRLAIKDDRLLGHVVDSLIDTLTYNPVRSAKPPKVTALWPEHEVDRFLFKHLVSRPEWSTGGLAKDWFEGYGQTWDGIFLVRESRVE